jgi:hypothetical protein
MEKRNITVLSGHVSPDTAYLVESYPYGGLRCKIRCWIETTKNGQRFCSQTTDPKRSPEHWNKPKKSTYTDLMVLYIDHDDRDHLKHASISTSYVEPEQFEKFLFDYGDALTGKYEKSHVNYIKVVLATKKHTKILTEGKNLFDFPKEEQARILVEARKLALRENGFEKFSDLVLEGR